MKVIRILYLALALCIPLVGWAGDGPPDSDLNEESSSFPDLGLEKRGRQDRLGLTGGHGRDKEGRDGRKGRRGRDDGRGDRGKGARDDEKFDEDESPDMTPTGG